jgi:two-component system NarL family response regulator
MQVVGEATTGQEARDLLARLKPEVAVLDLMLPGLTALDLLEQARREDWPTRVVVITASEQSEPAQRALQLGAQAYLGKGAPPSEVLRAVREAHRGGQWISSEFAARLREQQEARPLSAREREVLRLLVEGRSNAEIGLALNLSVGTVRTHVAHILEKLQAADRTEAATLALRRGLV